MGRVFNPSNGRDRGSGSNSNVDMNLEDRLDNPVVRVRRVSRHADHTFPSLWRQMPTPPHIQNLVGEVNDDIAVQVGEGSVAIEERVFGHADHTFPSLWRQMPTPPYIQNLAGELNDDNVVQVSEGSVAIEERPSEPPKTGEISDKKDDVEEGQFFDCNICFELAKEPIVTCCGHLFCWPCIYRWLNRNPDVKECPVCKGEVNVNNVTPIYGRGNNILRGASVDCCTNIPLRPHARRVESLRQPVRRATGPTTPIENLLMDVGSPFHFIRSQSQNSDRDRETTMPETSDFDQIFTSRGMRRESVGLRRSNEVRDNRHNSRESSSAIIQRTEGFPAGSFFPFSFF